MFELDGIKWMISDYWNGLAVYRSEDFTLWKRCPDILRESGTRPMDTGFAHHADVVVKDGRACIFYFCHPFSNEGKTDASGESALTARERNRAVVQAAQLIVQDGVLVCDRNAPAVW